MGGKEELTDRAAIIENDDGLGLPAHAGLEVVAGHDVLHEEIEEVALLGLLEALDAGDELAVDEEAFFTGDGVDAHERMDGVDGVFADEAAQQPGVVDHFGGGVDGAEAVEERGEGWGEAPAAVSFLFFCVGRGRGKSVLVGHVCSCKDGVAAYFRALEQAEHDIAWRLDFIAHVLMPERGGGALLEEARDFFAVAIAVNDMESRVIAHRPGDRLVVWFPEMAHELLQLFRASVNEILRGEGDDLALRD